MKTAQEWIDETPGVIVDDEHKADLVQLYKRIQADALSHSQEIVMSHRYTTGIYIALTSIRDAIEKLVKEIEK